MEICWEMAPDLRYQFGPYCHIVKVQELTMDKLLDARFMKIWGLCGAIMKLHWVFYDCRLKDAQSEESVEIIRKLIAFSSQSK